MVDPFASTTPTDPKQQPNKNDAISNDVFGGVPDIFADMAATAFQPIDPETGRPTEHTPETLDPFLRDDLINSSNVDMPGAIASDDSDVVSESDVEPHEDLISQDSLVDVSVDTSENLPDESDVLEEQMSEEPKFFEEKQMIAEEIPQPVEENTISIEETPLQEPVVDLDKQDTETPSYFETTVSFDDDSSSSLPNVDNSQKFSTSSVEDVQTTDGVSDHYDPFVDGPVDQSIHSVVSDDPFLQDAEVEQETPEPDIKDPFLEDGFSDSFDEKSFQDEKQDLSSHEEDTSLVEQDYSVSEQQIESPSLDETIVSDQQDTLEEEDSLDQSDAVSWLDDSSTLWQTINTQENLTTEDIIESEEVTDEDISTSTEKDGDIYSEEVSLPSEDPTLRQQEFVDDIDWWLHSLDDEMPVEPEIPIELSSLEVPPIDIMSSDEVSEVAEDSPSMVQWLVEGILDPFMSTKTPSEKSPEEEVSPTIEPLEESAKEETSEEEFSHDEVLQEDIAPLVTDAVTSQEPIDEEIVDEPVISEPTVAEEEQDMQKTWLSDVFVKFQELLQCIYRVHDNHGGHDSFTVVWADNDALYITYSFAIEASVEQAIIITKESTDRKDGDTIDTHILRFGINPDSFVEVYVDGVLLFVEDQLLDNVKAKMQLMDKFNKFIFLIDQFIQDSANQASWNAIASAQEEFGGF